MPTFRNCNHFANDLCERLTGNSAPEWVNRLAWVADKAKCLLPQGLDALGESPVSDPANHESASLLPGSHHRESDPDSDD